MFLEALFLRKVSVAELVDSGEYLKLLREALRCLFFLFDILLVENNRGTLGVDSISIVAVVLNLP